MTTDHPGMRLAIAGCLMFVLGALSLVLLPPAIGIVVMAVGGTAVWVGFLWTLYTWYSHQPPPQ
jgi:hypothetical protein